MATPTRLLQCGLLFISNPETASRVSSAHLPKLCLPPGTQTAGLFCWHALSPMGTAFVMTSFNRTCVLIGGNTTDTMDMPGSQCNVEPNRSIAFSFILVNTVCISYCNLVVSLVFKCGLKSIFIIQLNIFGPATSKKFVILYEILSKKP